MAHCIFCGSPSFVVDTRLSATTYLRRRRKCASDDCGKRFTTHEIPVHDDRSKELIHWVAAEARGENDDDFD